MVPCFFTASSIDHLQVVLGLPIFLFPCGFQSKACLVTLLVCFQRMCPIHVHFLLANSLLMLCWSFHPFLSSAILSRFCGFIFWVCASLVMVHWYISFVHPLFLFPDGFKYHASFGVLVGGILRTWLKYLQLLFTVVVFLQQLHF